MLRPNTSIVKSNRYVPARTSGATTSQDFGLGMGHLVMHQAYKRLKLSHVMYLGVWENAIRIVMGGAPERNKNSSFCGIPSRLLISGISLRVGDVDVFFLQSKVLSVTTVKRCPAQ